MFIRPKEDWMAIGIVSFIALLVCTIAHAEVNEEQAIRGVIGESLTDYNSMLAIACAIRNRGTLDGVYGVNAVIDHNGQLVRVIKKKTGTIYEPISWEIYNMANKAWYVSGDHEELNGPYVDVVKGATHWLSDYDLKHCRPAMTNWRFKYIETAYIGQTHFYKKRG